VNARIHSIRLAIYSAVLIAANLSHAAQEPAAVDAAQIDQRSYRLGGIDSFAEIVSLGIKKMALSAAMPAQDMDALIAAAERIAKDNKVQLYREADFLVTDLFPPAATADKHVLLIYQGSTKDEYLNLKKQKAELIKAGKYTGAAREQIARKLGKLLSYPDAKIDELLKAQR
jgi:hypothetical protein